MRRADLLSAAALAGAAFVVAMLTAPVEAAHAGVFYAASLLIIAAGRAADRLWDATMLPALPPMPPLWGLAARMPYRLLGGAIAFTVTLILARLMELAELRIVPVIELFATGAVLAAAYHATAEGVRRLRGPRRETARRTP